MHTYKEIPAKKYTRNINKKILNTGIFRVLDPITKSPQPDSPFKTSPPLSKDVFFQQAKYSFQQIPYFLYLAEKSYQQNKFYGLSHKQDKKTFSLIINASDILYNYNSSEDSHTDDEGLKELYNKLEKLCISYLNSYCRITFTREARQRKALVQSILKKCHKLISHYPNKDKPNLETYVTELKAKKEELGDNIFEFKENQHTIEEAQLAGFTNNQIFKAYNREAITAAYGNGGNLDIDTLQQIKEALNNPWDFALFDYTVEEAQKAGFTNNEIFATYDRDAIAKANGGMRRKLNKNTLQQIKAALEDKLDEFALLGYTVKDAQLAGFTNNEIFQEYDRDAIAKAYGKLNKKTLQQIKSVLGDNAKKFANHGYTVTDAQKAGFTNNQIFKAYDRNAIAKACGGMRRKLNKNTLQQIKSVLGDNAKKFANHGYTIDEARTAGFTNESIDEAYSLDENSNSSTSNDSNSYSTWVESQPEDNFSENLNTASSSRSKSLKELEENNSMLSNEEYQVNNWPIYQESSQNSMSDTSSVPPPSVVSSSPDTNNSTPNLEPQMENNITQTDWQTIKKNLNNIEEFKTSGYTAQNAKLAKFSKNNIFKICGRNEIVKVYGGKRGKLNKKTLKQIKKVLNNDIEEFVARGYTAQEAKLAKFSKNDIFSKYNRDEIVKVYGGKRRTLNKKTLQQIKTVLNNNIEKFFEMGYTEQDALEAGFSPQNIIENSSTSNDSNSYSTWVESQPEDDIFNPEIANKSLPSQVGTFEISTLPRMFKKLRNLDQKTLEQIINVSFFLYSHLNNCTNSKSNIVEDIKINTIPLLSIIEYINPPFADLSKYNSITTDLESQPEDNFSENLNTASSSRSKSLKELEENNSMLSNEEYQVNNWPIYQESSQNSMSDTSSVPPPSVVSSSPDTNNSTPNLEPQMENNSLENTFKVIKTFLDNDFWEFKIHNFTAEDAKLAGFDDKDIFQAYNRDAIAKAYGKSGKLNKKTLQQIKEALNNKRWVFPHQGYTVEEAQKAGFEDNDIFQAYSRDAIAKAYGKRGKLNKKTLQQIKKALNDDLYDFVDSDYTVKDAQLAGFTNNQIFQAYSRDAIAKAYGKRGKLNKKTLQQIKSALGDKAKKFAKHGYTIDEAKTAGFTNKSIDEVYRSLDKNSNSSTSNDVESSSTKLESQSENNIPESAFKRIKYFFKQKDDLLLEFKALGFTVEDARIAGFKDDNIFSKYKRDEIVKSYGNGGNLDADTLKQIKEANSNDIFSFKSKGYTVEEAQKAGFEDHDISIAYRTYEEYV